MEPGKEPQVEPPARVEIPLEKCAFWVDKTGDIFMSIPNDVEGHFVCMFDGVSASTNSYPVDVWKMWGYEMLDPVVRDPISDALTVLD